MENAVPSMNGRPLLIRVSLQYRFTAVAVDPQVPGINHDTYDVIYIGTGKKSLIYHFLELWGITIEMTQCHWKVYDTDPFPYPPSLSLALLLVFLFYFLDDGRLLKVVNIPSPDSANAIVISENEVFPKNVPIKQIKIVPGYGKVIAVSKSEVKLVTLNHCSSRPRCRYIVCVANSHPFWRINIRFLSFLCFQWLHRIAWSTLCLGHNKRHLCQHWCHYIKTWQNTRCTNRKCIKV